MVLSPHIVVVVEATLLTTPIRLCTGECVDRVWLGYLREDGLVGGGGAYRACRGLWNAQVDIPRWWRD